MTHHDYRVETETQILILELLIDFYAMEMQLPTLYILQRKNTFLGGY